ncbi:MAG: hypothetical protein K6C98_09565 [Treponema sp.]|nr:hypothetical protein [Treponema sp.]
MKKTITAFFTALLIFGINAYSDSKGNELYKKMMQANSRPVIAAKHKNWYVSNIPADNFKKSEQVKAYGSFSYMAYHEPDFMYFETKTAGMVIPDVETETGLYTRTGTYWNDVNIDGTERLVLQWCVMTPEEKKAQVKNLDDFAALEDGEANGESFVSFVDNGDGSASLTTNAPADKVYDIAYLPSKWKKATIEYVYLLDAKTFECKGIDASILIKKKRIPYYHMKIEYDIKYEGNSNMQKLFDFEKRLLTEKPENLRKATVIYNPGSPDEKKYEKVSDMSYFVYMIFLKGYKFFENPELTVPFEGSNGRSEFTVYLVPENN